MRGQGQSSDMVLLEYLCTKLVQISNSVVCCLCNRRHDNTNLNMSGHMNNPVESYLYARHERAMIRLCALLWILKMQEEREAQSQRILKVQLKQKEDDKMVFV